MVAAWSGDVLTIAKLTCPCVAEILAAVTFAVNDISRDPATGHLEAASHNRNNSAAVAF